MFDFEKGPEFWSPSARLGELLDALSFLDIAAPDVEEPVETRSLRIMPQAEEVNEPAVTIQPDNLMKSTKTPEAIQPGPKLGMPGTKTDKTAFIKEGRAMVDEALEGFDAETFMNYEDLSV